MTLLRHEWIQAVSFPSLSLTYPSSWSFMFQSFLFPFLYSSFLHFCTSHISNPILFTSLHAPSLISFIFSLLFQISQLQSLPYPGFSLPWLLVPSFCFRLHSAKHGTYQPPNSERRRGPHKTDHLASAIRHSEGLKGGGRESDRGGEGKKEAWRKRKNWGEKQGIERGKEEERKGTGQEWKWFTDKERKGRKNEAMEMYTEWRDTKGWGGMGER